MKTEPCVPAATERRHDSIPVGIILTVQSFLQQYHGTQCMLILQSKLTAKRF